MRAELSHVFRCCCFARRSRKTPCAFVVLPRVHSQVCVFVRASTVDGLIYQADQAQGFLQDILCSIVVAILRKLKVGTEGVLTDTDAICERHVFPLPSTRVADLTRGKETVHPDDLSTALFHLLRQQVAKFAQSCI